MANKKESSKNSNLPIYIGIGVVAVVLLIGISVFFFSRNSGNDEDNSDSAETSSGEETAFDYSAGIADNGYFENIRALDYVTLPDGYDSLNVSSDDLVVDEDAVDVDVQEIMDAYAVDVDTNQPAEEGNTVNIDYAGTKDGVAFTGGTAEGQVLVLGEGGYVDGFEDQIVGHSAGDTFDINITFPEDYADSTDPDGNPMTLAGEDVVFEIILNSVTNKETSEKDIIEALDYVTLKDGSKIEDMDDVRQYAEEYEYNNMLLDIVMENLTQGVEYAETLPESMLEQERATEEHYIRAIASSAGHDDVNEFLEESGYGTLTEYLDGQESTYVGNVQYMLLIQAIAEDKGIEVTDEEVREYYGDGYDSTLEQYGYGYMARQQLMESVYKAVCDSAIID